MNLFICQRVVCESVAADPRRDVSADQSDQAPCKQIRRIMDAQIDPDDAYPNCAEHGSGDANRTGQAPQAIHERKPMAPWSLGNELQSSAFRYSCSRRAGGW